MKPVFLLFLLLTIQPELDMCDSKRTIIFFAVIIFILIKMCVDAVFTLDSVGSTQLWSFSYFYYDCDYFALDVTSAGRSACR